MRKKHGKWAIPVLAAVVMLALELSIPALCGVTAQAADTGIAINEANFPDPAFRAYVAEKIDSNGDGMLSAMEIAAITLIHFWNEDITSLQGLEFFDSLEKLGCTKNQLTELDVSKNLKLESLECWGNQLIELDVSNNIKLERLECMGNQLTELDVINNIKLEYLDCSYNQLTTLDVSKNIMLEDLVCSYNQLIKLDVSKNTNLRSLACFCNHLTELDISKNIKLEYLECSYNQLTKLDVSKNIDLERLDFKGNKMTAFNVSCNTSTNLKWLFPFADVKENDWFFDDVLYMSMFYIDGVDIRTFAPSLPATRTVLVEALFRAATPDAWSLTNPFNDVPDDADYAEAVCWAASNGIVTGRGDGTFDPEGSITRQDLAVIFLRYMKYKDIKKPVTQEYIKFADEAQISNYAKEAMQTLHKLGIIHGVGGNVVDPRGTATRAQLAAMLRRFLELVE